MVAATALRAIGNSTGLTVPVLLLEQLAWQRGDILMLKLDAAGRLIVEKQLDGKRTKTEQTSAD